MHVSTNFLIQYLRTQKQSKASYFTSAFLGVCLDLTEFIICLVAPDNSKLIGHFNTHEALITNFFDTNVIISLKLSFSETFFHVETSQVL